MGYREVLLVAGRETRLLRRSRASAGAAVLLAAVAWFPVVLLPLRRGTLGLATFEELLPLELALAAVVLPLLALLAGAELLAGEIEDGSLAAAVTLPISRHACLAGKCIGRGGSLSLVYVSVFASAGLAVAIAGGGGGGGGLTAWLAVTGSGLLLSWAAGAIGVALGAGGNGRVRAFGAALVTWVGLVFLLDAVLLTAIVALAPAPPESVGSHGHGELTAPASAIPADDPHARGAPAREPAAGASTRWLLAANPVGLFRLTSVAAGRDSLPTPGLAPFGTRGWFFWLPLAVGWAAWLGIPLAVGVHRFGRANLA